MDELSTTSSIDIYFHRLTILSVMLNNELMVALNSISPYT